MKRALAIAIFVCGIIPSLVAEHIKGGEMYYEYIGPGQVANTSSYRVTLKLYIDCNATSAGQLDSEIRLTVFNRSTNTMVGTPSIAPLTGTQKIMFDPSSNPCIGNPPVDVCYNIRFFSTIIDLPINEHGYIVSYQRCCRINGIVNLSAPSNAVGATYIAEIPGTDLLPEGYKNSSPRFVTNDASAICMSSTFTLSFAAEKSNPTDSLVYGFCSGFIGASQTTPSPTQASIPPYSQLSYQGAFSGGSPLGGTVNIDSKTGLISGVAPGVIGQYVITVCAFQYREGILINVHHKDIHVKVSDCIPLKALLNPDYSYCDDFLVQFKNNQINPPGSVYIWTYGDGSKPDTTTDIEGKMQHQYADTGRYVIKLKVILAGQCLDSTTSIAKVYPGFRPGFRTEGSCLFTAIRFIDTTTSRYGVVSAWRWNFGDETTLADTSHTKNPSWKFNTLGIKNAELIVQSDKGCIDTVSVPVEIKDKPTIGLAFKDTLICSNPPIQDTLQLHATGLGIFTWTPNNATILNANSPDPLVFPTTTSIYNVQLNENGCINNDAVRVRVVNHVTLDAGPDSTICLTDTIRLHPSGDGLKFTWTSTPAGYISDPALRDPMVAPAAANTTYHIVASIGKCNTPGDVDIKAVPYPTANAGADTTICFEDTASLHASMIAATFTWRPSNTLGNPGSLNTLAYPRSTTDYILEVRDVLGCPKPGRDTVKVIVHDEVIAFAGNDTSIVVGQPLHLHGTGAEMIEWQPPTYLNRNDINDPIVVLNDNFTYIMKAYTPEGCFDYDTINIKVFKTNPDIFVPNAFRPGTGRNYVLRPIAVGISNLEYFRVYNRWGQMVYQSTSFEKGWDGSVGGKAQASGTYVWMAKGTDFTGKVVLRKGTAVLIR